MSESGYPLGAVAHLLALGVARLPFPAALGGEGLGLLGLVAVLEELGAVDGSLGAIVMGTFSANALLAASATPAQRRAFLAPLLAGEGVAAVAVTEAGAGTDVASIQTTCSRLDDGGWRLDGAKVFISNTGHPLWRLTLVLAAGPSAGRHTLFLVPSAVAGLRAEPTATTIGWSRSGLHDLRLEGVTVPDAYRLGPPDAGLALVLSAFERGRVAVGALAAGLCRAAWEDADGHARRRRSFGVPLFDHDAVADHVVELWQLYERARLVTEEAAAAADRGLPLAPWAALAKREATDVAVQAARLALEVRGASGLVVGSRTARMWGDAKALEIVEGTSEAQALVLRRLARRGDLWARPDSVAGGALGQRNGDGGEHARP